MGWGRRSHPPAPPHPIAIPNCRTLATRFRQIRFKHCYREANRCANKLARIGSSQTLDFVVYHSPPMDILSFLEEDANGLYLNRLVLRFRVYLVRVFKHMFSVFKQHYMYFHTLFYSYKFPKKLKLLFKYTY